MSLRRFFALLIPLSLILPASVRNATAQDRPAVVRLIPGRTDWDWQGWTDEVGRAFETALANRVRAGLPKREFVLTDKPVELKYLFRVGTDGKLIRFVPLVPEHRYLSYLIERTARDIQPLAPLPANFPAFLLEGEIDFTLYAIPTGRYKRFYFEEPLDSLELPGFEPLIQTRADEPLLLYEPPEMDKNKLLEDYRRRIGIISEITDTSGLTPLDIRGMYLLVRLPYDSLPPGKIDTTVLRDSLRAALEREGAHVLDSLSRKGQYGMEEDQMSGEEPVEAEKPGNLPPDSIAPVARDSALIASPDSAMAAVASPAPADTGLSVPSITPEQEIAPSAPDTVMKKAERAVRSLPDSLLPARDLSGAFASVLENRRAYLLSVGLARDSLPGRAICRLTLSEAKSPKDLKRRIEFRLPSRDPLPDSLGRTLVNRMVHPPAKPKPPEPPKPKTPPAAADSTRPAAASADSTAAKAATAGQPADSTHPNASAPPAATSADSSRGPAPAQPTADSLKARPDTTVQPQKTDSTQATPTSATIPATGPNTSKAPAAALTAKPDSTAQAAPVAPKDSSAARPDSVK